MNAIVKREETPDTNSGLLVAIQRVAENPQADIEKMERLMALYERMEAKRAVADYASAFAAMQCELPSIGEKGNAAGRYTYALWEHINAAIKPILSAHGFAISFKVDGPNVTATLMHVGGHSDSTTITVAPDASGNKNAVQALGSAISYGKRYTASALLNLTSHGEDDDAFRAVIDEKHADWLDKIDGIADETEAEAVRKELKAAFAGTPPKELVQRWQSAAKRVKGAA